MKKLSLKTRIRSIDYKNRWYPASVNDYKNAIKVDGTSEDIKRLRSNFAYSMQYIQYIEQQLTDLNLTHVITTMLYKSYIITAMSIIEALFVNFLMCKSEFYIKMKSLSLLLIIQKEKSKGKSLYSFCLIS